MSSVQTSSGSLVSGLPTLNSDLSVGSYDSGATVQKHIYVYTAPHEEELVKVPKTIQVAPKQVHYKLIFVKAPSSPTPVAPIIPAQPQDEHKTLVYVLVKKPEEQPDIKLPTPLPTTPSKPEVYFVKYNTQKEVLGGGSGISGIGVVSGGSSGSVIEGGNGLPIVEDAFRSSLSTSNFGSSANFVAPKSSAPVPRYGPPISGISVGSDGSTGSVIEGGNGLPIIEDAFRSSLSTSSLGSSANYLAPKSSVPLARYGLPRYGSPGKK